MMALPFVLLVFAGLAAVLGLRQVSMWIWVVAIAAMVYTFREHASSALNLVL